MQVSCRFSVWVVSGLFTNISIPLWNFGRNVLLFPVEVRPDNITCFIQLNENINDVCHFQMAVLIANMWVADSAYHA